MGDLFRTQTFSERFVVNALVSDEFRSTIDDVH